MTRNFKLFPLLAHVATARATGRTFAAAAGLDHLDAALALAVLRAEGLVTDGARPDLTDAGERFAVATLDGYRHLAERIGFAPSRAAVPA